jgi:hypothetical protein
MKWVVGGVPVATTLRAGARRVRSLWSGVRESGVGAPISGPRGSVCVWIQEGREVRVKQDLI